MKKALTLLLALVMLLSLIACGKTETPEKGTNLPNDQTENNTQQNPDPIPTDPIPTDPVSKEVYDLKHNDDLVHAPLTLGKYMNFAGWVEVEIEGAVRIWENILQFWFIIPKSTIDATVGYKKDDMSGYPFSFKVYLREQNVEGAEYKSIHTNLVPVSIYLDPELTIYRCPFYDSGLLDIVEVDKTYDVVIAIYENDKVVGWCENELTWYEVCQELVETAEQNQDVIK